LKIPIRNVRSRSVEIIYNTLRKVGLRHDEGPDIGGPYAPYVQSERLGFYRPYAEQLVAAGHAYYCFCSKERLDALRGGTEESQGFSGGYDRHCRNLPADEIQRLLADGTPHVIRQKMPLTGSTTFHDAVYGSITVDNRELEDQILLKSDGFPTYNFANVVDDHAMAITHVVRGSEYLSSHRNTICSTRLRLGNTNLCPSALIIGKDGRKLSKRHGSTSFEGLVEEGYLRRRSLIILRCWAGRRQTTGRSSVWTIFAARLILPASANHLRCLIMTN
jgi:glutamyl-tRNA synthetase